MDATRIISARIVVTMCSAPIPDGAVAFRDGRIISVGAKSEIIREFEKAGIIDVGDGILMPALVNAHTHISLSDAGEVNTKKPFSEWLMDLIAYRRLLTDSDILTSSTNGLRELIRNGITTTGDSDLNLIPLQSALANDFRGVFYFEVFGLVNLIQTLGIWKYKRVLKKADRLANKITRIGISPHTPYTVTPAVMRFASSYADQHKLPVSMHVAESMGEIEFMRSRKCEYRKMFAPFERRIPTTELTPLNYVDSYGIINNRFICAHGVHLADDEFNLLAKRSASLVTCPSSNHNLHAGHLDIRKPLDASVNLCVGTDSPASGDGYDLFNELRLALRIPDGDEISIEPVKALEMITTNPAKALGFEDEVGTIEAGKAADLIALKMPGGFNCDVDNVHDVIVQQISGDDVMLTISMGKVRHSELSDVPVESPVV